MKTSPDGIKLLHFYEGCELTAYPDPATGGDPWTIGWGDTGPDVVPGLVITQADADARFAKRIANEFEPMVLSAMRGSPNEAEFSAMVCLAYNIGVGAFKRSTLVRKFNGSDKASAADQFLRWHRAGGQSMKGLRRRRAAERALFLGASADEAIAIGAKVL